MITKAKTEIILSGFGIHLGKSGRRLVVTQNGKIQYELPASQVDGVYILTRAAAVTAEAVRAITESGATLAFINRHGKPYGFIVHPEAHSNAELRAIQMQVAHNEKGMETPS